MNYTFKMHHWVDMLHFPMKTSNILFRELLMILLLFTFYNANAQTPNDAEMMPLGDICFLLSYDYGSFDEYWEGSKLRENATIATVERKTVLPMVAVGVLKNVNLYVSLPHVSTGSTEPNGGKFAGVKGFQDLGLSLKYRAFRKEMLGGELLLLSSAGYSTHASTYLAEYIPYSLGLGAKELFLRGVVEHRLNNGLHFRGNVAHLWRGYAKAERDYYYSDGSRYSHYMDVPNAWSYEGAIGFKTLGNALK